ncbi:aminotransferase class I/II-fold pyridoxal phosphate-dependent enzyme [Sneathiella sp. P13V-1]|uniref:pyridoxal phosphate-dependent aminotransferase n=1 Tax=Sneathiella sp. P13V-1 TaxID=2697366 RepID=UPI00187B1178|nr:pyridoxal phosphate-dependent aminotransferase [Sneathiella sp. P13V-1]MBE7637621.1 aminotransferase class I/II-fold pyridoxal phosphate-dependent enzyme [Sneathiella sp. P13V-1]
MSVSAKMSKLGTETAFDVLARAAALANTGMDVINLGIGQPDFPTPAPIVEAGIQALKDGHHGYTAATGIPELREAVAEDIAARRGVSVNPDHILIMPGGKMTMSFAIEMFGEEGAEILYPNPGFPIYESMIRYSGATPVPIPLLESADFSFKAEDVLTLVNENTRLIIINTPANPTGGVIPREELEKLAKGLKDWPGVFILSDEIYSRMTYDGLNHCSLLEFAEIRDRLILLDGWSKTYAMTGWRLGWGLWPEQLIEYAKRLCVNYHSCVNSSAQYAGIAALKGDQSPVDEMMTAFNRRRKLIVARLNEMAGVSCVMPKGAFYAFPNITGTGLTAKQMQDLLLEKDGIATIAGTSFGKDGEGYIRFSYANSEENIERAMDRMEKRMREIMGA